ncbi:unnamed protein product [Leptidea sinapis]|uniref:Uncharacterized protein n=1 Tax=Leptidea sinapis TaxID=189913 RepID=A0A5E4Q6V9_9NEOP|nr:unnamed protein product [Leptidea sinapis]
MDKVKKRAPYYTEDEKQNLLELVAKKILKKLVVETLYQLKNQSMMLPVNVLKAATTSEIYNNNIKSKQIYNNRYVLKIKKGHHQDVPNQICRNL